LTVLSTVFASASAAWCLYSATSPSRGSDVFAAAAVAPLYIAKTASQAQDAELLM